MNFYADLHIHSRFSRATSRDASLEEYSFWARRKGLTVLATGDFTHPAWMQEIREKLVPAEPGLLRLRPDLERQIESRLSPALAAGVPPTRFIIEVEISTIYKKGDLTRKVHHLIVVPDLEAAGRFVQKLSRIGNLASDGRPILGLDSRHLLEIALESGEGAFLIPAHIWTPWFSALGSKSGFDAIEDCYGDLAGHVFAAETGLSADPPMNWRLSALDRYRLVSNSDAHSPSKLGREACAFDTDLSYFAMREALRSGQGYAGTVEFFPEEGKYHMDGHRKCGVCLLPDETRRNHSLCPSCGKPLTVGVMNRVEQLADRPEGFRPPGAPPFQSFVPLPEMLSEIMKSGPDSMKVQAAYERLIASWGPELFLLGRVDPEALERKDSPLLAEALRRMRSGRVIRDAGYDGEYGVIRLFAPEELAAGSGTGLLLEVKGEGRPARRRPRVRRGNDAPSDAESEPPSDDDCSPGGGAPPGGPAATAAPGRRGRSPSAKEALRVAEEPVAYAARERRGPLDNLDPEQRAAAETLDGPLLVVAGPGTGKTRTLTHRIAHLISARGAAPEQCLAITFTHRAAGEMVERLRALLPDQADRIPVMTFHALGHRILREHGSRLGLPQAFRVADEDERGRVIMRALSVTEREAGRRRQEISRGKRSTGASEPDGDARRALETYDRELRAAGWVDFDDLITLPVTLLENDPDLAARYRDRYRWLSVDEYQDVDECQYRLIRLLMEPGGNLCAIGDPDQAIYGFRGTDVRFFQRFTQDFPGARVVHLTRNYRSGAAIVGASVQVIAPSSLVPDRRLDALREDATRIAIRESPSDKAEAEFVVHAIEQWVGGSSFFSMDSGRVESEPSESRSFADFAVLYRTDAQSEALCKALARSGMPYQKRSHLRLSEWPAVQAVVAAMSNPLPLSDPSDLSDSSAVIQRLDRALRALAEDAAAGDLSGIEPALRALANRGGTVESFLSDVAMASDVDLWDPRADAISLLTLHASKGLEFPVVFIVGCEDGILPWRWAESSAESVDEERRVFFVGMTRARDRLILSHARKRQWLGRLREMSPSPFLKDIEEALLDRTKTASRPRSPREEQLPLL